MFEIALVFDDNMLIEDIGKGRKECFGIWLQDGQTHYPSENWFDNGLIILSWWTVTWQSLVDSQPDQGISFMEGPYHLSVIQEPTGKVKLVDKNKDTLFVLRVEELGKQLRKALNAVIRHFHDLDLRTENLESLIKCLKIVETGLKKVKTS